ncbi:MAG TPA: isoprenylcysteine carboxylmethyltransferase family protein [Solirubrobacterales bacterium]|nr:isoprenylcysteine carboxylmethyltransferase family protein [Solirubrobacterales bacterium]
MTLRHAIAIILLPGTVTVVIPALILAGGEGADVDSGIGGLGSILLASLGVALIAAGSVLWASTVRLFAARGKGTLAPWDPTQKLVVEGPYRHVRNPMISGVLAILVGEAVIFGSLGLAIWSAAFVAVNHAYFVLVEEPGLERRFGDDYRDYKRAVPRWIPRRRVGQGSAAATGD